MTDGITVAIEVGSKGRYGITNRLVIRIIGIHPPIAISVEVQVGDQFVAVTARRRATRIIGIADTVVQ